MASQPTFIITREDRAFDPVRVVSDGIKIGRLQSCELVLNHPTVSRLHAEIQFFNGRFYIFNFSQATPATINGRLVEQKEALADGDIVQIGPFFLAINRTKEGLNIKVTVEIAYNVGDTVSRPEAAPATSNAAPAPHDAAAADAVSDKDADALNVFWDKRKREAGKMARPSPLRPKTPPRLGKARFNWIPTRDLVRPYPFSLFLWALVILVPLSLLAAFVYANAYSPAPVAEPHARSQMTMTPAIAKQPNANSCTSCHQLSTSMNQSCASCHTTEAFVSTVTKKHHDAGIDCTQCHLEHKGVNYRATADSLKSCMSCHNDDNKKTYNGKSVHTPHKGTGFGYPVVNDQWTWRGLDAEEWALKPANIQKTYTAKPGTNERARLSLQFHGLHIYRVGASGKVEGDKNDKMTCSSCHQPPYNPIDRKTPVTTCNKCHTGKDGTPVQKAVFGDNANCVSCHVQHVGDKRQWKPDLFVEQPEAPVTLP